MEKIIESLKHTSKITYYSVKMFFRDRTAIFFSLFLPILIMSVFGVMDFEGAVDVKLGIVDHANNQVSESFVKGLLEVESLTITEGELETELKETEDGNRDLVLVIPEGFGTSKSTQKIETYYNEEAKTNVMVGTTIINQALDGYTHQISKTPYLFELDSKPVASKGFGYIDYLLPGIVGMGIMFMSVMGVVGVIVNWREQGVLRRLLATPVSPTTIITSQVITRLTIAVLQAFIIIGLGLVAFDLSITIDPLLILLFVVMGGVIFLNFGFALSGVANSQNTVMALTNIVIMPQLFLSGLFFPREGFPDFLQKVSKYLPLSYLNDALRGTMIDGSSLVELKSILFGLTVWMVITFFAATKMFKWE